MNQRVNLSRRGVFRLGAAAGAFAVTARGAMATDISRSAQEVIEWNAHMFSSDVSKFPFHKSAQYKPDPSRLPANPAAAYLEDLAARGVDRAVLVQPEPYGDDHSLILECLNNGRADQFRGTSLFFPKDPTAPQKLAALVKSEPRIVSTRFHKLAGNLDYFDTFADDGVRALWRQAADLGLVIELHIGPEYGKQVRQAIVEVPDCKVLIDHLAEPQTGNAADFANILDLANLPNVYMKMSELGHVAKDPPFFESLYPFTRRIIREFGPDKLIWSGGDPAIADLHLFRYSEFEISMVKGGNIRRILQW